MKPSFSTPKMKMGHSMPPPEPPTRLLQSRSDGHIPLPSPDILMKHSALEPKKRRVRHGSLDRRQVSTLPPATPFKWPVKGYTGNVADTKKRNSGLLSNRNSFPNMDMLSTPSTLPLSRSGTDHLGHNETHENISTTSLQRTHRAVTAPSQHQKDLLASPAPYFPSPYGTKFEQPKLIGLGSFGEVYRVYAPSDGKYYAIKKLRRPFRSNTERARALYEVNNHKILSTQHRRKRQRNFSPAHRTSSSPEHMRTTPATPQIMAEEIQGHPHCVRYFNHWEHGGHLYIQAEYCRGGALKEYLQAHRVDEITLWRFLGDLTLGLYHIHSSGFVHLDLKPENIFITDNGYVKIGDFGTMTRHEDLHLAEQEGDNAYLAPEMLVKALGPPSHFTDIFSLGLILYEMAADVELPLKGGPTWHGLRHNNIPGLSPHSAPKFHSIIEALSCPELHSSGPLCGFLDPSSFGSTSSEEDKEMENDEWVLLPDLDHSASAKSLTSSSSTSGMSKTSTSTASVEAVFPRLRIESRTDICPLNSSTIPPQHDKDESNARRALFSESTTRGHVRQGSSRTMDFCSLTSLDSSRSDDSDATLSQALSPFSSSTSPSSVASSLSFQSTTSTLSSSKPQVDSLSSSFNSPLCNARMIHSKVAPLSLNSGTSSAFSASSSSTMSSAASSTTMRSIPPVSSKHSSSMMETWDHEDPALGVVNSVGIFSPATLTPISGRALHF